MSPALSAFLASWSWEPSLLVGLAMAAGLYTFGWRRLRRRSHDGLSVWRGWCYGGGIAALGLALLSPIGAFSGLFFFMHMIQHILLVIVAAPLLLLGAPLLPLLWAFPTDVRRGLGRLLVPGKPFHRLFHILTEPLVSAALFLGTVAVWHVPRFYDAAQGRTIVHDLEHGLFLGTALLYWWPVIHPTGGRRRLDYGAAIPYLLLPFFEGNAIGALLTFASRPLYATYQQVPRVWGLSALEDQQLAGLIMWIPGGMMYLIPILVCLALLIGRGESAGAVLAGRAPDRTGLRGT